MNNRTASASATKAAASARPLSKPLTAGAREGIAGREGALGAERGAAATACEGAAWAETGAAAVGADGTGAAAAAATAGAGILIVGAAVGFGGRLMRTVSFLGWTLAASAGLGGVAPVGVLGMFSDINQSFAKLKSGHAGVKSLFQFARPNSYFSLLRRAERGAPALASATDAQGSGTPTIYFMTKFASTQSL